MGDEESVLFANDLFYTYFANRDISGMESLWADSGIVCIHPGWQPLYGREEVLESWRAIFGDEGVPDVKCRMPRATVYGNIAFIVCIEDLGRSFLCATNMFVRTEGEWRMTHHHAGPVHLDERDLPEEPSIPIN